MTRTIDTLDLFDDCVIPGCVNPVIDNGDVCQTCRTAFGRYLEFRPDTQPLTTRQITDRDQQDQHTNTQPAVVPTTSTPPPSPGEAQAQPELLALRAATQLHPVTTRLGMRHLPRHAVT